MKVFIFIFIFFNSFENINSKTYTKKFFPNGSIKEEGWFLNNEKTDYWFYYNENGNKKAEGHYLTNKKCKWWIFYNLENKIVRKSEYKDDMLNGLSIIYENNKIIKAEKYIFNKKIKDWSSMEDFKKDYF